MTAREEPDFEVYYVEEKCEHGRPTGVRCSLCNGTVGLRVKPKPGTEAEALHRRLGGIIQLCAPCARGDHSSHDNGGKPWDGTGVGLDAFDCKNTLDRFNQCCCRATWPKEEPA